MQKYREPASPRTSWSGVLIAADRLLQARTSIEVLEPARIHWSSDGWRTIHDNPTQDTGLGVHLFDLPAAALAPGTTIVFTLYWPQQERSGRHRFLG